MALPKLNLPEIQTKYKVISLIGIAALLFSFYHDHLYKPHAEKISELAAEMQTLEEQIEIIRTLDCPEAKNIEGVLRKIKSDKESILSEINLKEKKLPKKSDFSLILQKVTQLAAESGTEIKVLEPQGFKHKEAYESMLLTLVINAKFINLLNFLEQISKYSVYPERIYIEVKNRPDLTIRLNLSIIVR